MNAQGILHPDHVIVRLRANGIRYILDFRESDARWLAVATDGEQVCGMSVPSRGGAEIALGKLISWGQDVFFRAQYGLLKQQKGEAA